MPITLSQNEIAARAAKFAADWKNTEREEAEAQSFLIEFFHVLGVSRKRVAIFEHKVKCADGSSGYIDLFWKGHILIEMKSRGKDLIKAYEQAKRYADSLAHHEFPKAILVCDFANWHFYDLSKDGQLTTFSLSELPQYIHLFHYLAGYEQREYQEEDPVNVQAAELLGKLHDRLKAIGYTGHPLEVYLVRLLFCLFAEDTGIFRKDSFRSYILNCTAEDGRDLAPLLAQLFQVLNTPAKNRLCTRDASVTEFPYVNGGLFAEFLPMPAFDRDMRQAVLDCCALDWSRISPAIFGSMFQSVMNAEERRALGAHYTSERNILKLINPLFMDALREEYEMAIHAAPPRKKLTLSKLHKRISELVFLDPACGCGNFLVVAYRELRRLELDIIRELEEEGSQWLISVNEMCVVNVHQFYGIEIEEFPAQIAQVAMWLMDHQMNIEVGNYFGEAFARIPLTASATIVCGNALQLDWESVVPKEKLSYIIGNPPFAGRRYRTPEQILEIAQFFKYKDIDYVCCWFVKAAEMIKHTKIKVAFVSTNSITQGEQVGALWNELSRYQVKIIFAYRTFKWTSEARGHAAVHCVIIGFSNEDNRKRILFDEQGNGSIVENINGYLCNTRCQGVTPQSHPFGDVPIMKNGNVPLDGDALKVEESDFEQFSSCPWIKRLMGGRELLHNEKRYVLWLVHASPGELKNYPLVMARIHQCRENRLKMKDAGTRKLADVPTRFRDTLNPEHYIALPMVSSERRHYLPMAYLDGNTIPTNQIQTIPDASLYHFGVLSSSMHMSWMRTVAGRLKSDYRYSKEIVYNTFPWPEASELQKEKIAELAQSVLGARSLYPDSSLADLYDPLTMPPELLQAHRKLDAAVEKAYGRKFTDDAERVAFLFEKYSELTKYGKNARN